MRVCCCELRYSKYLVWNERRLLHFLWAVRLQGFFLKVKVKKLKQPAVGKLWWWITNPLITLLADDWCVSSSLCSVSDDGSMRMSPLVTVYSNGSVKADFQQRLTFACRLNLFTFPFDLQTCYISFSSLNSDGKIHQINCNNWFTCSFLSEQMIWSHLLLSS